MGPKESTEGQGRPYICDLPCVVKSAITGREERIKGEGWSRILQSYAETEIHPKQKG